MDKSKLSIFERGILDVLGKIYQLVRPFLAEIAEKTGSDALKKIIEVADLLFGE
jgi:hypothetical protein